MIACTFDDQHEFLAITNRLLWAMMNDPISPLTSSAQGRTRYITADTIELDHGGITYRLTHPGGADMLNSPVIRRA